MANLTDGRAAYFNPVVAIPLTKWRCARMKTRIIGATETRAAVIISGHCAAYCVGNSARPAVSVVFSRSEGR